MKFPSLILFIGVASQVLGQDLQPFFLRTRSLVSVLDNIGRPLGSDDKAKIETAIERSEPNSRDSIKSVLDQYVLLDVTINPESRVSVNQGNAKAILEQNGWKIFLVKAENLAGINARLGIGSDQAKRVYDGGEKLYGMGHDHEGTTVRKQDIVDRWLDLSMYTEAPMSEFLSGLETDYFILQLYSRDAGTRAARFDASCGPATQDLAKRSQAELVFECLPARTIALSAKDETGKSAMASLIIRDSEGRIYPSPSKRLAPDFFFQPQIYRADGETIALPEGTYSIETGHGPEYLTEKSQLSVTGSDAQQLAISLKRWIDPGAYHWYSGDHHIHASGCSHYTSPTEGVDPEDMMRHVKGEGVNIGNVLTWGPGYYHQKQFFTGKENVLSTPTNILRYDLEVSGFPSGHAGHLVLMRLKNQDYPGTKVIEDWPTWTIPILKWAKSQGAVTGYAHSGLGLEVKNDQLPNFDMPRFDGIGANEYIVAVTQHLVDFISAVDTPPTWELNIWYHTLNCGFRTRIAGETDFPCMSDEKVAHGRSYVKVPGELRYDNWAEGIKSGRAYVSDGKSHLMNFKINEQAVGEGAGELALSGKSTVRISSLAAAYLEPIPDTNVKPLDLRENVWTQKPFWNIERSRIGTSRTVLVELVVNGIAVESKPIAADGIVREIAFETEINKSSWVTLRILPSSHTNPIFVTVSGKPIRASKRSAQWCSDAVAQCWKQKSNKISEAEKPSAKSAYDAAAEIYRKIVAECVD